MKLARIDVRFFRSFNHDYEARARGNRTQPQWDELDPWLPFVRVPIDAEITAVVGANESGKSQLLLAIKALLTGSPIKRSDFCRYSELYSVKDGELRLPEFGGEFIVEPGDDLSGVAALIGADRFELYRLGTEPPFVVLDGQRSDLTGVELTELEARLPSFYELATGLAIPDSVSIAELAGELRTPLHDRRTRSNVLSSVSGITASSDFAAIAPQIAVLLQTGVDADAVAAEKRRTEEFGLARRLLVDAARIDQEVFSDLREAILEGREGEVEAIVGGMNSAIKENLNIQRWWTQDRDFDLLVEAREHELAFTVQDRTGAKYSFAERSQGLRYFLSYFVQLAAHKIEKNGSPDLLLLDEPDAFLSSAGQQDLLRVLHDYAFPEAGGAGSQVVYVTHSPFLIDKNAPERIRVLDKGVEAEGTRVVNDAANNRYEPLRSSLGTYVAETAFIGGQNLFVEGQGDQVLLSGLSNHSRRGLPREPDLLDLNKVTIVACGGADSIPYMVYLARGRDTVKPPCVVLLDGDDAGRQAQKVLKRGEARKKRVLADDCIVMLDEWASTSGLDFGPVTVLEIEDLIPISIAHRAAINYLSRFRSLDISDIQSFTTDAIAKAIADHGGNLWDGLHEVYRSVFEGEHLEKVGLAREVVALVDSDPDGDESVVVRARFESLLSHLALTLDMAAAVEAQSRGSDRLERILSKFEKDFTNGIKKHDARRILLEVRTTLSGADFPDQLHGQVERLQRDFDLADPSEPLVPRFDEFRRLLLELRLTDRLQYQDDAEVDPAATLLAASSGEGPSPAAKPSQSSGAKGKS